jgi:hypothetical protein
MKKLKSILVIAVLLFVTTGYQSWNRIVIEESEPVTDYDGNTYKTVKIGNQIWMAENLKTTRHNDGQQVPYVTDNVAWDNLQTPGYCFYNNDSANFESYDALYKW